MMLSRIPNFRALGNFRDRNVPPGATGLGRRDRIGLDHKYRGALILTRSTKGCFQLGGLFELGTPTLGLNIGLQGIRFVLVKPGF